MKMLFIKIVTLFLLPGAVVARGQHITEEYERKCRDNYLGECLPQDKCERETGQDLSNIACGHPESNGFYTCCPIYYGWAKCTDQLTVCVAKKRCGSHFNFGQMDCKKTETCCGFFP